MHLFFPQPYTVCEESKPTFVAEVVDHDDLSQVSSGSPLDDTVDGSHQRRPAFIMEDYHHTGGQQSVIIVPVLTPGEVGQNVMSRIHSDRLQVPMRRITAISLMQLDVTLQEY